MSEEPGDSYRVRLPHPEILNTLRVGDFLLLGTYSKWLRSIFTVHAKVRDVKHEAVTYNTSSQWSFIDQYFSRYLMKYISDSVFSVIEFCTTHHTRICNV